MDSETISMLTIPLFTGAIGYLTNWTGVLMLFYPIRFWGIRPPGLKRLVTYLPRKVQQIPGVLHGGIGWQGIIPSRAEKMGSIAVDKGIAKLGSPQEFYEELEPDRLAEHVLESNRDEMRELVERVLEREHPELWNDLPPQLKRALRDRIEAGLPEIVRQVTHDIGANIENLMDVKLMVIRRMGERPELANRVFLDVARRELRFIINFGFLFGLLVGIPLVFLVEAVPQWWVLPVGGSIIGWVTNWVALWMIFEPIEPRKWGPFGWYGLFMRRQDDIAEVYGGIIADDVVTAENMGQELLHGPQSDRTRRMIEARLRPAVDRAAGVVAPLVRVAVGTREYDAIRESLATEGVEYTMTPMSDPDFNREQSARVQRLLAARMRELPAKDFSELMRSAVREDEWLLPLHGAVLGIAGGLVHLAMFGV
jgi:uncharacterized membrane protein YheB (UPF0754 family)